MRTRLFKLTTIILPCESIATPVGREIESVSLCIKSPLGLKIKTAWLLQSEIIHLPAPSITIPKGRSKCPEIDLEITLRT